MIKKKVYNIEKVDWLPIRKDISSNVFGKSLLPNELTDVTISYTKVEHNGEFKKHIDSYHHVLYFIKGQGVGYLDNEEYIIEPNLVIEIPAGISHGYKNNGKEELFLITINIPKRK
ncbi:MAG: cupin domain-containing protein [Candidatus Heimdallarchaeota archaeon]